MKTKLISNNNSISRRDEKRSTLENNLLKILSKESYIKSKDLAKRLDISSATVYNIIRRMREHKNTPIMPTKHGYILAEYATLQDDVHLIRKINGRRISDQVLLGAVSNDIHNRWTKTTSQDQKTFTQIIGNINTNKNIFITNTKLLNKFLDKL